MNTTTQTKQTFTPLDLIDQIDNHQLSFQKLTWINAIFSAANQSMKNSQQQTARELIGLGQYLASMWADFEDVEAERLTKIKLEQTQ